MVGTHSRGPDEGAIPAALRRFFKNRLLELAGLLVAAISICLALALISWSPADPFLVSPQTDMSINWLGGMGASLADALIRSFGLGAILVFAMPLAWGSKLISHRVPAQIFRKMVSWTIAVLGTSAAFAMLMPNGAGNFVSGSGGSAGQFISEGLLSTLGLFLRDGVGQAVAAIAVILLAIKCGLHAIGLSGVGEWCATSFFSENVRERAGTFWGFLAHCFLAMKSNIIKPAKAANQVRTQDPDEEIGFWGVILGRSKRAARAQALQEPRLMADDFERAGSTDIDFDSRSKHARVERKSKPIKSGKRVRADEQPSFFPSSDSFALPPLHLLGEPQHTKRGNEMSDEALEQNARMLENVLDDFGVRGEITKVHPGPVVTLYELEPAPGIKSSRVIGLADDIARSMSAISARVAVIPGRNAIGIELPNHKRETVYLKELLGSEAFENSSHGLCLALGKNIGGEPIFADLTRMPHLLIAGTTGSGKSVGINTMILSLLYRLPPESCRLIMIDPKMLELSVYEGIPHLLSPVVTDPRKAVVALKWAVREMEERYRKMSKLGVRNIDGYNARLKQAVAKGETMGRTVQTGYDHETGQPIFETEQMDMKAMPYIVVVIDEMADLMMVAGKEIEGAVQRLAQMARAAGIHVVMATQRPSVDVITGTIKANFPTRVSFQVTSKIDSRTILGEQGAEQLLGQGDMLYMIGGGRISRLHAPFVSDEEVEKIVGHLRAQGSPEYVDAVTEEPEGEFGELTEEGGVTSGDALYDQAVAVVLRDRKVSTSYIQRRLQIGYNKAASLIERMEVEGLISSSSATGKREILVGGEAA